MFHLRLVHDEHVWSLTKFWLKSSSASGLGSTVQCGAT